MKQFFALKTLYHSAICLFLGLSACTYASGRQFAVIKNGWIASDSSVMDVAVHQYTRQEPTGLSKFPDGGKARITSQSVILYRCDLKTGVVSHLAEIPASNTVWTSFEPRVWSVTPEGTYVLFTGCPKGGECYGPQNVREIYRVDPHGTVSKVNSGEPLRNEEPNSLSVSAYPARIDLLERFTGTSLYQFILDPSSGKLSAVEKIHSPIQLSKKNPWLIEIVENGGFAPRLNRYTVSADGLFTLLSSTPEKSSKINPESFKQITDLLPSVYQAEIATDTYAKACLDCTVTTMRLWQQAANGAETVIEQSWNNVTQNRVSRPFIELFAIIKKLR